MSNNTLDLRRHSREIKRHKWMIIASIILFAMVAIYYWQHHMPEYNINSVMLIEEEQDNGAGGTMRKAGGISQMMRAFSIGGFGASSVDNERIIAETRNVMVQTIKDLGLNCTYIGHDGIKREILYGGRRPVIVEAPSELYDTLAVGLKMKIKLNGDKADIKVKKGFFKTVATLSNVTLPCEVKTPYGDFKVKRVTPTSHFKVIPSEITVNIASNSVLAAHFRRKIEVGLYDKKADALEISYNDPCPERGIDMLNTLMENYNNVRKEHKDEVSRKEIEFYDSRIALLAQELNDADNRMVEFKRNNNIVDLGTQAGTMIKQNASNQQEAVKLQAEIEINQMILNALNKSGNSLLPTLGNDATVAAIYQYNELISARQELEKSAKGNNEALISLNEKIAATRRSITESAQKSIDASRIKLSQLNVSTGREDAKMSQEPSQEKEYLNLLRDKELKNELFIFLMQRRESSMLQLTKNSSPSFIIEKAYKSVKPSLTKPMFVTLALLLMGILLPLMWILYRMKKNNKVKDPYDLNEEWEPRVHVIAKAKNNESIDNQLHAIRSHLFKLKDVTRIFVYDITHVNNDVFSQLVTNVERANKSVATIKLSDVDKLYSDEFSEKLEKESLNDYIFIVIENMTSLSEIFDRVEEVGSGLLLLIKKNKLTRDDFSKFVKDFDNYENSMIILS